MWVLFASSHPTPFQVKTAFTTRNLYNLSQSDPKVLQARLFNHTRTDMKTEHVLTF